MRRDLVFNRIGYNMNACACGSCSSSNLDACNCGECSTNNYTNTMGKFMYQPMNGSPLQALNGRSPLQALNGSSPLQQLNANGEQPSIVEQFLGLGQGQALTTIGVSINPTSVFLLGGVLIGSLFVYDKLIK